MKIKSITFKVNDGTLTKVEGYAGIVQDDYICAVTSLIRKSMKHGFRIEEPILHELIRRVESLNFRGLTNAVADMLIQTATANKGLDEYMRISETYRPSLHENDKIEKFIADCYDAEAKSRGLPVFAFR